MKITVNTAIVAKLFSHVEQYSWNEDEFIFKNLHDDKDFTDFFDCWIAPEINTFNIEEQIVLKDSLKYVINFLSDLEIKHITTDRNINIPFGGKARQFYIRIWSKLYNDEYALNRRKRKLYRINAND